MIRGDGAGPSRRPRHVLRIVLHVGYFHLVLWRIEILEPLEDIGRDTFSSSTKSFETVRLEQLNPYVVEDLLGGKPADQRRQGDAAVHDGEVHI